MRHGNKVNHLSRKTGHRNALLKNLSSSLIISKRITTTLAKAKVLRSHIEPLITKAVKENTTHSRRVVFSYLQDKEAVKELFGVIADKIGDRPGGYLRIIKTGNRLGDGAPTAMIEFVDFNDTYQVSTKSDSKKKRTRRSGAAKKSESSVAETKVSSPVDGVEPIADEVTPLVEETPIDIIEDNSDASAEDESSSKEQDKENA